MEIPKILSPSLIKDELPDTDGDDDETLSDNVEHEALDADVQRLTDSSHSKINCVKQPGNLPDDKHKTLIDHQVERRVKKLAKVSKKKPKSYILDKEEQLDKCGVSINDKDYDIASVGRRMASLNASAMMHATFGREEKRARRDPLTIAIEASLKDMKDREERLQKAEEHEEEPKIGRISSINTTTDTKTTSDNIKSPSKFEIKNEKVNSSREKDNISSSPTKDSAEVVVKEEICSPSFSSSIEGLSESDIKTKLIESASAKIKSKISRQSSDEKFKKKIKKAHMERADEKVQNKSKSGRNLKPHEQFHF